MRTYLTLKDKAAQWNADPEIKSLLQEIDELNSDSGGPNLFSTTHAAGLLNRDFDRASLAAKGLKYERLDQLTIDTLLGVR